MFGLRFAILHVHDDDNTQVVVRGNEGSQHTDDCQPVKPAIDHGAEEVDFSDQSQRWRETDEREHEDRHGGGKGGIFFCETRVI